MKQEPTLNDIQKDFKERIFFQKTAIEIKKNVEFFLLLISKKSDTQAIDSTIHFINYDILKLIELLGKEKNQKVSIDDNSRDSNSGDDKNTNLNQTSIAKLKNSLLKDVDILFEYSVARGGQLNKEDKIIKKLNEIINKIDILKSIL